MGVTSGYGANCYDQTLDIQLGFVPDLRLNVYNDPAFSAVPTRPNDNDPRQSCRVYGNNQVVPGQEAPANYSLRPANYPTDLTSQGIFADNNPEKRSVQYNFTSPNFEALAKRTRINQVYNNTEIKDYLLNQNTPDPYGLLSDIIAGDNTSSASAATTTIKGNTFDLHSNITNLFDIGQDIGYWTCSCPIPLSQDVTAQDCYLPYEPEFNRDVCTTKRIYLGYRTCYSAAWWQISGGNVFAYQNITDAVPGNPDLESACQNTEKCIDTQPASGSYGFKPDFDEEAMLPTPENGDRSCTPRIIRGRTPCKADGPSNSAGVALTNNGLVTAVDEADCRLNGNCLGPAQTTQAIRSLAWKAQRVTERANIHALHQGNYQPNDRTPGANPSGLQAKIANSRVLPYTTTITTPTTTQYQVAAPNTGLIPIREDYRYFVSLFGGIGNLRSTTTNTLSNYAQGNRTLEYTDAQGNATTITAPVYSSDQLFLNPTNGQSGISSWCNAGHLNTDGTTDADYTNADGKTVITEVYTCYIPGILRITTDNPWIVTASEDAGTITYRKYIFFVAGRLELDSNHLTPDDPNTNDAATTVDVGNFLSFIVGPYEGSNYGGDIYISSTVGVSMPNPATPEGPIDTDLATRCWEGQSATLNGNYPPQSSYWSGGQVNADKVSAYGNVEGIFVADGSLIIDNVINDVRYNQDDIRVCRADKRFLAQGTFITWGNVQLLRDFNNRDAYCQSDIYGLYNNRVPTETFIYRPDLVRHLPDWMRRSSVYYQERTGG